MNSILECLHILLSQNVMGDIQYHHRYKGFVGELDFQEWMAVNRPITQVFAGGYFLPPKPKNTSLTDTIYFTISDDHYSNYRNIYIQISKLDCRQLFYIQWDNTKAFQDWKSEDVMQIGLKLSVPNFQVFYFDKNNLDFIQADISDLLTYYPLKKRTKKNNIPASLKDFHISKLARFSQENLIALYVQRLFFDGFIGFGREHGIPSDIDLIIEKKQNGSPGKYLILEIKEKDLSKRPPSGFGMDLDRIKALSAIQELSECPVFYVVRHIDNQTERNFLAWKLIGISDFIKYLGSNVIEGGTGMRSETSSNPTKICPAQYFKTLG
ncbi:hypothetical protein [Alkanindiges illinoisensis]|uniref:hypothetical protein n=1 Tax=Alkanindiges illinoisensis TaxID=197183 RepID=UPI00047DFE0C|nr:hypothetical protein [Alkanindiges illinoisensis]